MFSILMTVHNGALTIKEAIESCIKQNYQDWELLILDNGSTDETAQIINGFSQKDNRIHSYYKTKSIGWPHGISYLLHMAKGNYMSFLAADDYYVGDDSFQEIALAIKSHNEPDIIMVNYCATQNGSLVQNGGEICEDKYLGKGVGPVDKLLYAMRTTYYNSMFHFEKISFLKYAGIDFFAPFFADCAGMTEAILRADSIYFLRKTIYNLRLETSQTRGRVFQNVFYLRQWKSICDIMKEGEICNDNDKKYLADRILMNAMSIIKDVCQGNIIVDDDMREVNYSIKDRIDYFDRIITNEAFKDLMSSGSKIYCQEINNCLNILMVLLQNTSIMPT